MMVWHSIIRYRRVLTLAALMLVLACPAAAWANEGGVAESQAARWYNALWTLGLFSVLLVVLGRYAWKPVLNALRDREQTVIDTIADAERRRAESDELLSEYRARLESAAQEAKLLMDRSEKQAIAAREELLKQARAAADSIARDARQEIDHARREALEDIYRRTAELATDIAGKIIHKELRPEDHQQLIRDGLEKMKQRKS
jgi:F-type H+-transporting ATPase subunit b